MEIMLVDLLTTLPQNIISAYYMAKFIDAKHFRRTVALLAAASFLAYAFTGYVLPPNTPLRPILVYGLQLIVIFCCRQVPMPRCLIFYTACMAGMTVTELPMGLSLLHFYPDYVNLYSVDPAFLLLWKLSYLPLLTACYMLVSFLLRKIYRMEQSRDTLRFLPFLLVQLVLLMLPLTMVQNAMGHYKSLIPVMLLYSLAHLMLDVFLVGIFNRMGKAHAVIQRQQEAQAMLETQTEYYQQMQDSTRILRQLRHDVKNQLTTLSILLEQEDYETAQQQLSAMEKSFQKAQWSQDTGNAMVDAVLVSKKLTCGEAGIRLLCQGALPGDLGQQEVRLCSLISRLLDQAIAACGTLPMDATPEIRCSISADPGLRLCCRYPAGPADAPLTEQLKTRLEPEDQITMETAGDTCTVTMALAGAPSTL